MESSVPNFLKFLKKFPNILVSGPQRSGTTFIGYFIAQKLGYTYYAEETFDTHDFEAFQRLLAIAEPKVIQCPGLCHRLDEIEAPNTIIVFSRRAIQDIIKSQQRVKWDKGVYSLNKEEVTEDNYEKLKYLIKLKKLGREDITLDFNENSAAIKYAFWDSYQREKILHKLEVEYEAFKEIARDLWVDKEVRQDFHVKQVGAGGKEDFSASFARIYYDLGDGYEEKYAQQIRVDQDTTKIEVAFPPGWFGKKGAI